MVVAANLRGARQSEAPDAAQDVLLDLTSRLRRLRDGHTHPVHGEEPLIRNFRAYIASAARRAAGFILRRSNPERYRLRNRIRYSLGTDKRFTLTEDDQGRRIAALSRSPLTTIATLEQLQAVAVPTASANQHLPAVILTVLTSLNVPVLLDDLTDYLGAALGGFIRDEPFEAASPPSPPLIWPTRWINGLARPPLD